MRKSNTKRTQPNLEYVSVPYRAVQWTPEKGFEVITEAPLPKKLPKGIKWSKIDVKPDTGPRRFAFDGHKFVDVTPS